MTFGQKLKKLRNEKNLTQKDLADQLHVTFQTVSKWENDENEPDVATLRELAKLFDCSMDYLLSEEELEQSKQEVVPQPAEPQQHLHICESCGKEIPEDDVATTNITHHHRSGRHTVSTVVGHRYYHKACLEKINQEAAIALEKKKIAYGRRARKLSFIWGIVAGAIALGISLGIFLGVPACREAMNPAVAVVLSVVISYAIFADLYCIISGSYIGDVFTAVSGWSIRFPGLIFSWDLEGFAWLIAMKILFAVLGFLFGVFVLALAIVLSAVLAAVSFPFVLIHNIRNRYDDALISK